MRDSAFVGRIYRQEKLLVTSILWVTIFSGKLYNFSQAVNKTVINFCSVRKLERPFKIQCTEEGYFVLKYLLFILEILAFFYFAH